MSTTTALPASILTSEQYEQAQLQKVYSTEKDLGRDAFLKLFTTQLTNQNPLEPMDNEAFVSQLAQFSSLESMKGMQTTMEDMAAVIRAEKFVGGSNLLGRYVTNDLGIVAAGGGQTAKATAQLDAGAEQVLVRAFDSAGQEVYRNTFGRQPAGEMSIDWNGEDDSGEALPYDAYKIVVTATVGGAARAVPVQGLERIKAVHWDSEALDYTIETDTTRTLNSTEVTTLLL
jgi:flagellar basal-body rod modification protein FlgD